MRLFAVYAPPEPGRSLEDEAVRMAFVKDGLSWPALFVPLLWLLWHRLWLVLVGWLAIVGLIAFLPVFVPVVEQLAVPAALLFAVLFALEANGLRRWTLERHGWRFVGLASGRNRFECELDFFARWLAAAPVGTPPPGGRPGMSAGPRRRPGEDEVIGLFPRSG